MAGASWRFEHDGLLGLAESHEVAFPEMQVTTPGNISGQMSLGVPSMLGADAVQIKWSLMERARLVA